MKFQIEIDCTPSEAREFFGLPNIAPMQERLLKELEEKLSALLTSGDPEFLLKTWLPAGMTGLDQMQKAFWDSFTARGDKK